MHQMATCCLAALVAAAEPERPSPDPAALAVPAERVTRARQLVRQLGSDAFRDRDRAARELTQMGRAALPALEAGRDHPDPEVRMRVEFRAVAGDDPAARDLYAEALKNRENYELLLALRGVPADQVPPLAAAVGAVAAAGPELPAADRLNLALDARRQEMQYRTYQQQFAVGGTHRPFMPEPPEIALLLLAESMVDDAKAGFNPFQYQVTNYLHQEPLRSAAAGAGRHGPALRRLVAHWMDTRRGPYGLQNTVGLAQVLQMGPRAVSRYAARVLTADGVQPWARANAAATLARNDGKEHLLTLTRLFTDDAMLIRGGPGNPQPDVQVRDAALGFALILTGQDSRAYNVHTAHSQPAMKFQYTNYQFVPDDKGAAESKRAAAFQKWRAWELGLHASLAGPPVAAAVVEKKYPEETGADRAGTDAAAGGGKR
jgi:hypothetical protein